MSENKKERINIIAKKVRQSKIDSIINGNYDFLLNMDMVSIIEKFNSGQYDVINSEDIDKFLSLNIKPIDLINCILYAKSLLQYKETFRQDVISQQDGMTYNPKRIYHIRGGYSSTDFTYSQLEETFEQAEELLSEGKVYAILRFLLKYESLITDISNIKRLFKTMKDNPERIEELYRVLNQYDPNVGIIKIVENGSVTVKVGTKHDMEISDLIGMPYPADCDEPGYDYGPHGDYYHGPHKVTKQFFEGGTTPNHRKMIEEEKRSRIRLSQTTTEQEGFIVSNGYAIIIANTELTKLGINPQSVGWRPLRLTVKPSSLFETCKNYESTRYLSLRDKVQLTTNVVLAKRQR